jgi:hypothetical protein
VVPSDHALKPSSHTAVKSARVRPMKNSAQTPKDEGAKLAGIDPHELPTLY